MAINTEVEPKIVGWLTGDMTANLVDSNGMVSNILDSNQDNSITLDWQFKGPLVSWIPGEDTYTLNAYLDAVTGGIDRTFDSNPAGPRRIDTGLLAGDTLTFAALQIPVPSGSVAPGVYGLTIVLTHQPNNQADKPRIFGFVDYGTVQFF